MTTVNKQLFSDVPVVYSKQVKNPWNEVVTLTQTLATGPRWTKSAFGTDQAGGVKAAARLRSPKGVGRRKLDPHSYTCNITRYTMSPHEARYRANNFDCTMVQPHATHSGHIPIPPEWDYAVIAKLRKYAYGSGFNPAVFAAEMPQALEMIGSSALRIRRALLCLGMHDWRGVFHNLRQPTGVHGHAWDNTVREATIGFRDARKTFSGAWLEVQYGWRPLLSDMEEAAKYIAEALNGPLNRNRVSARKSFQKDDEFRRQTQGTANFSHRATMTTIKYIIENLRQSPVYLPSVYTVASVAWEKLPYSFVCDWVVPIGSYIEALRTASDLQGTVVKTVFQETTWSSPRVGVGSTLIPLSQVPPRHQLVTLTRTVMSDLSPPLPAGDLSPSSVFSSITRALNALALLQNLSVPEGDRWGLKQLLQATPLPGRR